MCINFQYGRSSEGVQIHLEFLTKRGSVDRRFLMPNACTVLQLNDLSSNHMSLECGWKLEYPARSPLCNCYLFVSRWPRATRAEVYLGTFCHWWFGQQKQKWSITWGTGIFKALKSAAALLMEIDPDTDASYGGFNYSKSAVCVLLRWSEWKLCAAFPSRGGPGPPSKQTPTWCGAKWGGTRSTVSPHSECFVLDEAPIVVLGSQPHVTCLGMRKAPASSVLSAWGGPADQDTNITSGNQRVGKEDILWSSTNLFLFSKPQNVSAFF